jgi:hypothetical protein
MPSNINPQNINTTYPIAGQDNDTQGFRTNFTNIQNNFTVASSEITALQGNVAQLQTEIITGNITVQGNVITSTIISPAGSNANIMIDPDNNASVVVAGNLVVSNTVTTNAATVANLTLTGVRIDKGYQYNSPSTNFSYTVNNTVNRFILDPTTTIANGAITLPSANVDATVVTISSTQTVTALQVLPNSGCTLVPSANITLTGGTGATYFFHASESKWYKIG